jgi:hypothetical protein
MISSAIIWASARDGRIDILGSATHYMRTGKYIRVSLDNNTTCLAVAPLFSSFNVLTGFRERLLRS